MNNIMKNKNNTHIRHAKGPFAMTVVYSFTGAAILASIIFSLLLFLSLDENLWMKVLFGSLAVIFELGKFLLGMNSVSAYQEEISAHPFLHCSFIVY